MQDCIAPFLLDWRNLMSRISIGDLLVKMFGWFKANVDEMYKKLDDRINAININLDNI